MSLHTSVAEHAREPAQARANRCQHCGGPLQRYVSTAASPHVPMLAITCQRARYAPWLPTGDHAYACGALTRLGAALVRYWQALTAYQDVPSPATRRRVHAAWAAYEALRPERAA